MKKKLDADNNLSSLTQEYIKLLGDTTETFQAQVAILEKENEDWRSLLCKRIACTMGKRVVVKDKILLTTKEIRDRIQAAEAETQAKKQKKGKTLSNSHVEVVE